MHNYYVYITTNMHKSVLYVGVTNNLVIRLYQHQNDKSGKSFTSKYQCCYLVYWEHSSNIIGAIAREKELKGWSKAKKETLIQEFNPEWKFLTEDNWLP